MEQTWNKTDAAETETLAAFARRLDVARSTVTRAAQAGRLVLDAQGLVLIQASLTAWHASRGGREDVAQRHAKARGRAIPLPAAQTAPSAPMSPPASASAGEGEQPQAEDPGRATFKAQLLGWQNKTLRVELDRLSGRRLEREATLREASGLGATLRAAVERLIDQTAPRLAVATGAAERARLLGNEIKGVRRMLKAEYPRALRRLAERRREVAGAEIIFVDASEETAQ